MPIIGFQANNIEDSLDYSFLLRLYIPILWGKNDLNAALKT